MEAVLRTKYVFLEPQLASVGDVSVQTVLTARHHLATVRVCILAYMNAWGNGGTKQEVGKRKEKRREGRGRDEWRGGKEKRKGREEEME